MTTRLNKLLAQRGIGARRKCDALIQSGVVRVNGKIVKEPGTQVSPDSDRVTVNGRPLPARADLRYYALNKPVGVITTLEDPEGRPTIRDYLPSGARLFPVGRLDSDTSGLLILTNDGELAHHLMHPRYGVDKVYRVRLDRPPDPVQLSRLRRGVEFEPGVMSGPASVRPLDHEAGAMIEITIHEGRYRQVRRMCEAVGLAVKGLHRSAYGPLRLGPLARGMWRELSLEEVRRLREASARPQRRPRPRRESGYFSARTRFRPNVPSAEHTEERETREAHGARRPRGPEGPRRSRDSRGPREGTRPSRESRGPREGTRRRGVAGSRPAERPRASGDRRRDDRNRPQRFRDAARPGSSSFHGERDRDSFEPRSGAPRFRPERGSGSFPDRSGARPIRKTRRTGPSADRSGAPPFRGSRRMGSSPDRSGAPPFRGARRMGSSPDRSGAPPFRGSRRTESSPDRTGAPPFRGSRRTGSSPGRTGASAFGGNRRSRPGASRSGPPAGGRSPIRSGQNPRRPAGGGTGPAPRGSRPARFPRRRG